MRTIVPLALVFGLWAFGVGAEVSATQIENAAAPGRVSLAARVVWLDKQTNRREQVVIQEGSGQTLGGMAVTLTKCVPDVGGAALQDVAWLEVREPKRDAPWFAGWMFNTFPDVATLEHPRYDLMLVGCGAEARAKPAKRAKIVPPAPDAGSYDTEGGAVEEAPAGKDEDPYYVPGLEKKEDAAPATEAPAAEEKKPEDDPGMLRRMMDGVY